MRGLDRLAIRSGCLWFNPIRNRAYFCNRITNKNNANMKTSKRKLSFCRDFRCDSAIISNHKIRHHQNLHSIKFLIGELYLFHPTKKYCPSQSSLWGIYDKTEDGIIYLESSTLDFHHFSIWHRLPNGYRYSRRATRRELSDYMYNLGRHINNQAPISKATPQSIFIRHKH